MKLFARLKEAAGVLLAAVLLLLLLEMLARIAGTVNRDIAWAREAPPGDWFIHSLSPEVGWERKPGYKGPYAGGQREFDSAGYYVFDTPKLADSGKKKVVFLGDSNTFGYGVPTQESFVEVVGKLLPDVHTINLGVNGYTSYQGRVTLMKRVAVLKPDVVVVAFGTNDRRYVLAPDEIDGADRFFKAYHASRSNLRRVVDFLEFSYLYRGVRQVARAAGVIPKAVGEVRLDAVRPRVIEEDYRANLAFVAEEARRRSIAVIFMPLRDNPLDAGRLIKGVERLGKADHDVAIAYLTGAVNADNGFSDLARIILAEAYRAQGDEKRAGIAIVSPEPKRSLHGGPPVRLDTAYNAIMRQVARDHGAAIVEGTMLVEYPHVYTDWCHFNAEGHRRVGEMLAARISAVLRDARPGARPQEPAAR
jgi:lysophospholipase L1-like esterase